MNQTILITGSTDGIGLETAKTLVTKGCTVLLHGRNSEKLMAARESLATLPGAGAVESYLADLSNIQQVDSLAQSITENHQKIDVLINNAGVFKAAKTETADGLDIRFMVNTIAPYRLTQKLLPLMDSNGRILNLSSAAQATVNVVALTGKTRLTDMEAYAQSKLAITMWSRELAKRANAPTTIAVNPGSMLGTKMVKDAFGADGHDIRIGADILIHLALDKEFENASGQYFDNDIKQFGSPHKDAFDERKSAEVVRIIESILAQIAQ